MVNRTRRVNYQEESDSSSTAESRPPSVTRHSSRGTSSHHGSREGHSGGRATTSTGSRSYVPSEERRSCPENVVPVAALEPMLDRVFQTMRESCREAFGTMGQNPDPMPPPPRRERSQQQQQYVRDSPPRRTPQPPVPPPPPARRVVAPFAHDPEFQVMRKNFMELRPRTFSGGSDVKKSEEWLDDVLTLLQSIQCEEKYYLELVVPLLKEKARHWWRGVERVYPAYHQLTWKDFLFEFEKKNYPKADRRKLEREFLNLTQGVMGVREYEEKFNDLSRWAPQHVDSEEKKVERFVEGLKYELKKAVVPFQPQTFYDAVAQALLHEQLDEEKPKVKPEKRYVPRPMSDQPTDADGTKGRENNREEGMCKRCGKHPADRPCRMENGTCFRCGETGHYIKDCPEMQRKDRNRARPELQPPPAKRQAPTARVFALQATANEGDLDTMQDAPPAADN